MPSRPASPRLRPCIAELLRTCVHPESLLLRVEKVVTETIKCNGVEGEARDEPSATKGEDDYPKEVQRLWLSDGELMIQALMEHPLHHIFATGNCGPGSLLDVKRFRVRRGKRVRGAGEVIYLAIADYESVLGGNPATSTEVEALANAGGFIREVIQSPDKTRRPDSPIADSLHYHPSAMLSAPSSQGSDGFETAMTDPEFLKRRRQVLHQLGSNTQPLPSRNTSRYEPQRKRRKLLEKNESAIALPADNNTVRNVARMDVGKAVDGLLPGSSLSQDVPNASTPTKQPIRFGQALSAPNTAIETKIPISTSAAPGGPLHELSSLVQRPPHSPLPSRNYTCSIFAVVSWCSPNLMYPRHAQSPFPPKRHIKIHDPSIASRYAGVTLAVYDNAQTFKPRIGTVALFRGVVMQRWEGEVILNAYVRRVDPGSNSEQGDRGWYEDDEDNLRGMGYDVRTMRDWWAERSQGVGQKRLKKQSAT